MASNYGGGPVSLAIYIDRDYREHSNKEADRLKALFDDEFKDIGNKYELIIGILYVNRSDDFWLSRKFRRSTPMMFKFPTNSLRNLAESQVTTQWLFNSDIDFSYFAHSIQNEMGNILKGLNRYIADPKYGEKSIFIVPSFEVLTQNEEKFGALDKKNLLLHVAVRDIFPFHEYCHAQRCTRYHRWYHATHDYALDYQNRSCYWAYEPWYIMRTDTSRKEQYQWNNSYIGRGLNKVERAFSLRHHCFNFIVLHDLFMIHSTSMHLVDVSLSHEEKAKWNQFNLDLFTKQKKLFYEDEKSCSKVRDKNRIK